VELRPELRDGRVPGRHLLPGTGETLVTYTKIGIESFNDRRLRGEVTLEASDLLLEQRIVAVVCRHVE
jgi:hypothetical protein